MNKIARYFQEAKEELLKVTWPTKKQTAQYSLAIIGISILLALFITGVDYVVNLGVEKALSGKSSSTTTSQQLPIDVQPQATTTDGKPANIQITPVETTTTPTKK